MMTKLFTRNRGLVLRGAPLTCTCGHNQDHHWWLSRSAQGCSALVKSGEGATLTATACTCASFDRAA